MSKWAALNVDAWKPIFHGNVHFLFITPLGTLIRNVSVQCNTAAPGLPKPALALGSY